MTTLQRQKDVKSQTSKLVNLGFSGRHHGLDTIVITQQLTSIAKAYRENITYKKARVCKLVEITDKDFLYMVAPTTRGLTRMGVSLLQESAMTYVYGLLAAQAVNPEKIIVGNNEVALMIQKSFVEKIKDRIKADNGVDNILELYKRMLKHSTATGTLTVHERVTKIPTNLKIEEQKQTQEETPKVTVEEKEIVDVKPFQKVMLQFFALVLPLW